MTKIRKGREYIGKGKKKGSSTEAKREKKGAGER